MKNIIGVSGVAGVGKDTFFDLLSEKIACEQYSLANALKDEVRQWCRMHYNVDSVSCSREEKEIIRPFLVFHGSTKRRRSNGRHWIDKLNDDIIKSGSQKIKVITDIRYDDFENDEAGWVKNELGGVLVHISQYTEETDIHTGTLVKKFKTPANAEEARNEPKLIKKSDYKIEWEFIKSGQINELEPFIDDFLRWFLTRNETTQSVR